MRAASLWCAVAAMAVAVAIRYAEQPSFWLDEAFVAVSLRTPSAQIIFAPLEYGQYFPRLYLALIALVRQSSGYAIWSLRLLPFICFLTATVLWARLLYKRSGGFVVLVLMSAALLLGASFWLDQAIQLKQYTFDVLLALVPFLVGDEFYTDALVAGRRKTRLVVLALGCLVSYTYPFALGARLLGWYLWQGRRAGWRINLGSGAIFLVSAGLALAGIWLTDYRFNFADRAAYLAYWNDCILSSAVQQSAGKGLRLLAKYFWGWHGREPLVTAGLAPLQMLGVYSVIKRWRTSVDAVADAWGARSLGSITLVLGMILASVILSYPICAGRVTLFVQVHLQILGLEGAWFLWTRPARQRVARAAVVVFLIILAAHSLRDYARFVRAEILENIRPLLPMIKPEVAGVLWVHSCSEAQVRSLPDSLPVQTIQFGTQSPPPRGERVWILWTHLGADYCRNELEQLRSRARDWQVVDAGADRGLALAEF